MKLKITSKSQLNLHQKFDLKLFKKPFCDNETKNKYKLYQTPKFRTEYFKSLGNKKNSLPSIVFFSPNF